MLLYSGQNLYKFINTSLPQDEKLFLKKVESQEENICLGENILGLPSPRPF